MEISFPLAPSHMSTLPPCEQCGALRWEYLTLAAWDARRLVCRECNAEMVIGEPRGVIPLEEKR